MALKGETCSPRALWSLQAKASSVHSRNSEQLEMAAVKCIFVSKVQKKSCHIRSWAKHMPTATAKPAPCSPQGAKHALLSAALAMSTLSPLQPALAATVWKSATLIGFKCSFRNYSCSPRCCALLLDIICSRELIDCRPLIPGVCRNLLGPEPPIMPADDR